MKKVGKLFCQFAELSYLCTRFRKNFRGDSKKEAIFDILQTTTRQRPVLKDIRDVKQDTSIQKNNEFSKERKCLGPRQTILLIKCQSYHTLLYNI